LEKSTKHVAIPAILLDTNIFYEELRVTTLPVIDCRLVKQTCFDWKLCCEKMSEMKNEAVSKETARQIGNYFVRK
jgi:hypothetical protein